MVSNVQTDNDKGSYPTITIIDSSDGRQGLVLEDRSISFCCICVPEHVGVAAILSLSAIFGLLNSVASFAGLTIYSESKQQPVFIISGILYGMMCVTGVMGSIALRQENIVSLRRISIAIWVHTALSTTFNSVIYIIEVLYKNNLVSQCEAESDADDARISCEQAANIYLVKEAFRILFIEFFLIYFAYVVYRYSRRTLVSQKNIVPYVDGQITPTYVVYSTGPPTSRDWVPPPTYTVRPNQNNSVPSDTKDSSIV